MFGAPPLLFVIFTAGLGAIMGSYVNMAAYRLPRGISTVKRTRSFCPRCEHQLAWYENVPILSFLIQFGRCRHCGAPISPRYLWVELLVTTFFLLAIWQFLLLNPNGAMPPILFAMQLFFIVDMVLLSVCDLEAWIIPFETTLWPFGADSILTFLLSWPTLGFALALIFPELHAAATVWTSSARLNALIDSFQGMVIGAGVLWMVGFLFTVGTFYYYRLTGRPDRPKEGMGAGDCHLMAMVGAMLGWKDVLLALAVGLLIGCVTGVGKISWDNFQRWRLKDKYKPWQPAYPIPDEVPGEPSGPVFWHGLVMGLIVLVFVGIMFVFGGDTFDGRLTPTWEEMRTGGLRMMFVESDLRMWPVRLMFIIGLLLVISYLFFTHLERINMLPQGNIVEKDDGKKEEILEGNYIPFGPSLAMGALIVVFYAPVLRNAMWMMSGLAQTPPPLPYHVLAEDVVYPALQTIVQKFRAFSQMIVGG
jgi:leader peptidase (prepilin peptidase)/N-methyltransferase